MKQFEFRASGPESGDCTTPYEIVFMEECTVREFIDAVLKRHEWGTIAIGDWFNGPRIAYVYDVIKSGVFSHDILDAKIKSATSNGGWSHMNYVIQLFSEEEKLRSEYALVLKAIVRHESEIKKLQLRAVELEDKIEKINSNDIPPNLDRDGCVYWDNVLVKE